MGFWGEKKKIRIGDLRACLRVAASLTALGNAGREEIPSPPPVTHPSLQHSPEPGQHRSDLPVWAARGAQRRNKEQSSFQHVQQGLSSASTLGASLANLNIILTAKPRP